MEAGRMLKKNMPGGWEDLPDDVLDTGILPLLSNASILNAGQVCKNWRQVCSHRKVTETGTCLVKLYMNAVTVENSEASLEVENSEASLEVDIIKRLTTLQIHNPLRRQWYKEKVIGWVDVGEQWYPGSFVPQRLEAGDNGLFFRWRRSRSRDTGAERHHILVFNPLWPETTARMRRELPIHRNDSRCNVIKMVGSEDDDNAAQDYSILLFTMNKRLVIYRSTSGSWERCTAWPRLANPLRMQSIESIRRSCSGGRLYCLFQDRGSLIRPWEIHSCSIWRFDLREQQWIPIARVPQRVLKRASETLNVTLVGCGDRVLIVVIASGPPRSLCDSTEIDEEDEAGACATAMAEEDECNVSDDSNDSEDSDVPEESDPSEYSYYDPENDRADDDAPQRHISLVEVWECVGRDSSTGKARWHCLSQMPAEHVCKMSEAKFSPDLFSKDFAILDAEGCVYFSSDRAGRYDEIVVFDCIERSWNLLKDKYPAPMPRCPRFPDVKLLTFKPNKDAIP